MAFVCCITVVAIGKKCKRQNVKSYNTKQVELQAIPSSKMTQKTNQVGLSRQLSNTTLANCGSPPPFNESSNTTGPHEASTVVSCPNLVPQQTPAPYQQQAGHHLVQQPPSLNSPQPSVPPYPYETHAFNTFKTNDSNQSNTTAAPTSFANLLAHNLIIQASGQQGSNVDNCEAPSDVQAALDNPTCKSLNAANGEPEYEEMEETYEEIKY